MPKWSDMRKLKDKKLATKCVEDGVTLEYDWLDNCKIYRVTIIITELNRLNNVV